MTEDDTFEALKKWSFEILLLKIRKCNTEMDARTLITRAGWTFEEYCIEYNRVNYNIGNH